MKRRNVIDLTVNSDEEIEEIDLNNSSSSDFDEDPIISSIFNKPSKKQKLQQEDEDYKLAKSLQIAEYMNSIKENQIQKEKKNQMPISYYYKMTVDKEMKDDVEIIDYDLKNMESKSKTKSKTKTKEKIEEEKRLTTLNSNYLDNVLSPQLELLDPTPDIHILFELFNKEFFYDSLKYITVRWSKRMTLCAGICSMKGMKISIALSEPLLSLRQRSDTVNTLLHEMIHAYLFVTNNHLDHDDHGNEFQKHMKRINQQGKACITIYHTFHDEVESCRKWWWRCDGPCRNKPPYYGYVKRAMNRPPQKADWWFDKHQKECGGTYHLIKSPSSQMDKYIKK